MLVLDGRGRVPIDGTSQQETDGPHPRIAEL
jgi:hypothetical protein